jgi:hypothetical protein
MVHHDDDDDDKMIIIIIVMTSVMAVKSTELHSIIYSANSYSLFVKRRRKKGTHTDKRRRTKQKKFSHLE